MLMVGAAGRNAGKTAFACSVVSRFARGCPVVAVKATSIGPGGEGSDHFPPLDGDYSIVEERDPAGGKDTSRLLAAGAERVYWLRALEGHLHRLADGELREQQRRLEGTAQAPSGAGLRAKARHIATQ